MKVNRISLFLMAGLLISLANSAKGASDYCAFEVKVTDPSGAPLAGIPVAMIQQDDKEFGREVRTDHDGRARLCDAPMQQVSIIVGLDICGAVAVKAVRASWPATERLFITYEPKGCDHFGASASCTILLRLLDEYDHPVPGAAWLAEQGQSGPASDEYGRIFKSVRDGSKLEGAVSKNGYAPVRISVPCTHEGDRAIEKKVTMRKIQR